MSPDDRIPAEPTPDEPTPDDPPPPPARQPARNVATARPDYAPFVAVAAMIGTFIVLPPGLALTLIGSIWLAGTRGLGRTQILSLTLTEALAWAATIAIVEFLAALILFVASGGGRA